MKGTSSSQKATWPSVAVRRPHVDRTQSPVEVARKREYFKYQPETIHDFALRLSQIDNERRG
jgi:hypothetical protein